MTERDGERSASFVQEVAETCGLQLHRYLVKRLRVGEDAQDVAQEVYLRLLRLHRSDLVRQPAAYVYFIASQIVGEQRLRASKRPLVYDSELMEQAAGRMGVGDPDELADQEHAERAIAKLLAKLSAAHRAVFILRKRDGYSNEEIATKLGMSIFKVRRYLVEANATLESKLREQGR